MLQPQPINMALGQLLTNRVVEPEILDAMTAVPRERCVPTMLSGVAYVDEDLPLGDGRYLPAPVTFAHMVQQANLLPTHKVLDIGCAYGYSTAVLAKLAGEVIGCESVSEMAENARRNLDALHIRNARIVHVPELSEGYPDAQPYDAILINGAIATAPTALLALLADGGRLVTVEPTGGNAPGIAGVLGRLTVYHRIDGVVQKHALWNISCPLLPGFKNHTAFTF